MTEEVLVSVKGLQMMESEQEEEVEVITGGKCLEKNGTHYIIYEEMMEGLSGATQNLVKLHGNVMEVTKKGAVNVHMCFEKDKKTTSAYETPYGELLVGIETTDVNIIREEDAINATVNYALAINYEHLADCTLKMNIRSKRQ